MEDDGLKACEGLKAGGGVLLGLKADLKSSDPVPVSILSASLLSLKAGETVSEEKRGEAALALLRSLRGCLPRFVAGFGSHGRPTLTWPVGRRKFLQIVNFCSFLNFCFCACQPCKRLYKCNPCYHLEVVRPEKLQMVFVQSSVQTQRLIAVTTIHL